MKERRTHVRNMQERREFVRFQIDQMVDIRFGEERFLRAEGVDLSEKGIRCISSDSIEPYSRVFMIFTLPIRHEDYEIQCEGIVVRSVPKGDHFEVAVQFPDISEADQRAIAAFAKTKVPKGK